MSHARLILRLEQVKACTGLGRSSIYSMIAAGTFPKPIKLTAKASGWLEPEVMAWQAEKIAARNRYNNQKEKRQHD